MRAVPYERQVLKMKKASVLIIVSVLLAALLCVAGCSSGVEYTDEKTGVTVSLPDNWEEDSDSEKDDCLLAFWPEDSEDRFAQDIRCYIRANESSYEKITDYSEEYVNDFYSLEDKELEEKELPSGTYYEVTGSSDDVYYVIYLTVQNGCLIQFQYTSESPETPYLSTFEDMIDNAEFGSSSSDKKYSDKEVGFTVALPIYWIEEDVEDSDDESNSYREERMEFGCGRGHDFAAIFCTTYSGLEEDASISDFPKKNIVELYSVSADDVSKKKLTSGTYYQFNRTLQDDSGDSLSVVYVTIKNGYLIEYEYISNNNKLCLSDFEDMVDNAEYK